MKRNIIFFLAGLLAATLGLAAGDDFLDSPLTLGRTQVTTIVIPDPKLTVTHTSPQEATGKPGSIIGYHMNVFNPGPESVKVIGSTYQTLNGQGGALWKHRFATIPIEGVLIGPGQTVSVFYTVAIPLTAVRGDTLVSDISFSLAPPQLGNKP